MKIKKGNYLAKNILNNTFSVSSWIFLTIIELGEITLNAFLSPSYYKDLPEMEYVKSNRLDKILQERYQPTIRQSIKRLKKQGFIEVKDGNLFLTKVGKILAKYIGERKKILNKKWDKKYRIIIFDIPEKKKDSRNWLRQELYIMNYKKLQKSVFIGKYPLTEDIVKEIKDRMIGDYINYILADKIYHNLW